MELFGKGINYIDYEERKALIKKKIRERINNNPSLNIFLEENKAKGKFIKNTTEEILKYGVLSEDPSRIKNIVSNKLNNSNPILYAFPWKFTKQGKDYWNSLSEKFVREKYRF